VARDLKSIKRKQSARDKFFSARSGSFNMFSYQDIAKLLRVDVGTVAKWKSKGIFQIVGYRRLARRRYEAVTSEAEVKRLLFDRLIPPR
jgi:hypothetical protein